MEALLKVENIVKHFPIYGGLLSKQVAAVKAVQNISFELKEMMYGFRDKF